MNVMTKQGSLDNQVTYEHYCDTKADLENIPKNEITLGTVAVVLKDDDDSMGIYIADSNKEWNSFSSGGSSAEEIELEELTITENGVYDAEEGKGFNKVTVEVDSGDEPRDMENELITRTLSTYENSTVESIGSYAFEGCNFLTTVSIPECKSVGNNAFGYCSSLTSISFPKCTNIGDYAFLGCDNLSSVVIPECVGIGKSAFAWCSSLRNISLPKCNSIGASAFSQCFVLKNVYIPECTSIGSGAFAYCSSLATISLPKCNNIKSSAFFRCINLKNVYLNQSSFITLSSSVSRVFDEYGYSTITYYVPASLINTYKSAQYWSAVSSRFSAYNFSN